MGRNACTQVPWTRLADGSLESLRISYAFYCSLLSVSRINTMPKANSRTKGFICLTHCDYKSTTEGSQGRNPRREETWRREWSRNLRGTLLIGQSDGGVFLAEGSSPQMTPVCVKLTTNKHTNTQKQLTSTASDHLFSFLQAVAMIRGPTQGFLPRFCLLSSSPHF